MKDPADISETEQAYQEGRAENAERIKELEAALNDLLNDCINFGGENLTECILKQASEVLKR